MKLSASSSVIFATLAISSSTSSLAAPTRDNYDTGLSSPTKSSHTARDSINFGSPYRPEGHHKRSKSVVTSTASRLSTRGDSVSSDAVDVGSVPGTATAAIDGLLGQVLGPLRGLPLVGPLIGGILAKAESVTSTTALSVDGIDTASALSQDDMAALKAGVAELVRAFGGTSDGQPTSTSTPSSSAPVVSSTPTQSSINRGTVAAAALSNNDLNALSASGVSSSASSATPSQGGTSAEPTPSATSVVAAGEGPSSSSSASASVQPTPSAGPGSTLPTPNLPINLPSPPVGSLPVAVKPPSASLP